MADDRANKNVQVAVWFGDASNTIKMIVYRRLVRSSWFAGECLPQRRQPVERRSR